jgi:general secretion pathway protein L
VAGGRLAQDPMRMLRLFVPQPVTSDRWHWVFFDKGRGHSTGAGPLDELPQALIKRAERVQVVLPAAFVLITRARLPPSASRRAGSLLAYAVEETTASEPDSNEVNWLGSAQGEEILAVMDRRQLSIWREALATAGINAYSITCETLLLPWQADRWSCVWDGKELFLRSGELEGAVSDDGEQSVPPMALRLWIDASKARNAAPSEIALYTNAQAKLPDLEAWRRLVGVNLKPAGVWERLQAPANAGVEVAVHQRKWRVDSGTLQRLRPAAWIAGIALAIHAGALTFDWVRLSTERNALRTQMESRFRSLFPDAVAVSDPALQMRRKLVEVRRLANKPDESDFAVMLSKATVALKSLPPGALRVISYEGGRMSLEFSADDPALPARLSSMLGQSGFLVAVTAPQSQGKGLATLTLRVP